MLLPRLSSDIINLEPFLATFCLLLLQGSYFLRGFPIRILFAILLAPIQATFPANHIFIYFQTTAYNLFHLAHFMQ